MKTPASAASVSAGGMPFLVLAGGMFFRFGGSNRSMFYLVRVWMETAIGLGRS